MNRWTIRELLILLVRFSKENHQIGKKPSERIVFVLVLVVYQMLDGGVKDQSMCDVQRREKNLVSKYWILKEEIGSGGVVPNVKLSMSFEIVNPYPSTHD
ncbi:hypothetical protein WICPIJ_006992 [Wickerhamomyces pijperi]|uniref:Uncharacterized protein n=1 Tax=Wickerhamomyces pijperi TaxID=599730 RepID=A0A9P8TKV8_WICPI|nr:hypothetical protein WICPIJ_006992 [Wickerhamomyces pijperi]